MVEKKLYKVAASDIQYPFRVNLFMWPHRTLFFGPLNHLRMHSLGSLAINIGVYKPFFIRTENSDFTPTRCVIIPAGCMHEMLGYGNIVASLIIERSSPDFNYLSKRLPFNTPYLMQLKSDKWVTCLQTIYELKPSKTEIAELINQLFEDDSKEQAGIDPRLGNIIQTLDKLDIEADISQSAIAASEGLSSSRFRHLFKEQFNVPYRQYKIWRRVLSGLSSFHKVDNITNAAMDAGFSDSAHLNRCFRNTLGVNPSQIFKNIDRFEV